MERITFSMAVSVYWASFWRNFLIGGAVMAISSAIGLMFHSPIVIAVLTFVPSIIVHYFVIGFVFNKEYSSFSVALVNNVSGSTDWRWRDILPLWWSMFWRQTALVMILMGIFSTTMELSVNKEWKQLILYSTCQNHAKIMDGGPLTTPVAAEKARRAYQVQDCENVLKMPPPQANIMRHTPSTALAINAGAFVAFPILWLLAMMGVYYILLHKRYRKHHVRVMRYTMREGVIAS